MPPRAEVLCNRTIGGKEPLRVPRGLELLHPSFPLASGLMRVLGPVVEVAVLPMVHTGQDLTLGGAVALELIRDDDTRDVLAPLQQLPEESLRGFLVSPALHENIEDMAVLIHGPPEVVPLATDREEDLVQVPFIARPGTPPSELIGVLLAELPAPFADGLIRDDHSTFEEELFDIAVTEAEPEVEPDPMADDLPGETVVLVAVRYGSSIHAASMPHGGGLQQVDKAHQRTRDRYCKPRISRRWHG
jgi:hypothetical protein